MAVRRSRRLEAQVLAEIRRPDETEERAYEATAKTRGYGLPKALPMVRVLKIGARIPNWAWRPMAKLAARIAVGRNYKAVRQWRLNAQVMLNREPTRAECLTAFETWFENMAGSVQLGRYTPEQNFRRVVIDDADFNRLAASWRGPGAVVALPHMGDYDLAGAYFCAKGMPVSAVGERLPDQEFEYFMTIRQAVGMTVYPHGEPAVLDKLADDLGRGHVVALVSDRDLSRHSVPVVWHTPSGDHRVTMPPGPALLAQRTGADLLAAVCTFEGRRIRIRTFGPLAVTPGDDGLAVTSQRLADVFCREVAANVPQWHVMQRFFPGVVAT